MKQDQHNIWMDLAEAARFLRKYLISLSYSSDTEIRGGGYGGILFKDITNPRVQEAC